MADEEKTSNPLGMKPILDSLTKPPMQIYGELLKKAFTHDWIFCTPFEKLAVTGSFCWALFCIGRFIWGLF